MNPADSKKLKKIEGRVGRLRVEYTKLGDYGFKLISYDPIRLSDDLSWLISKVKEQDREIERLIEDNRVMNDALINGSKSLGVLKQYRHWWNVLFQRRHRKWALKKMRVHASLERYWVAVSGEFVPRAQKAEAEVERLLSYVDGNDKDVEIGDLEARVKEQAREIELERDFRLDVAKRKEYQRRHRKWALKKLHAWMRLQQSAMATDEWASNIWQARAEKAEVELEAQIEAGFIVCQAKLREIDALEARIAEQEREIKCLEEKGK